MINARMFRLEQEMHTARGKTIRLRGFTFSDTSSVRAGQFLQVSDNF